MLINQVLFLSDRTKHNKKMVQNGQDYGGLLSFVLKVGHNITTGLCLHRLHYTQPSLASMRKLQLCRGKKRLCMQHRPFKLHIIECLLQVPLQIGQNTIFFFLLSISKAPTMRLQSNVCTCASGHSTVLLRRVMLILGQSTFSWVKL